MKIELDRNKVLFNNGSSIQEIHPFWLRERVDGEEYLDKGTQQRLFDPSSMSSEIIIEGSFKKQFWQLLLRGIINGQAEFFLNTSETTDGMQSIYDIVKMESAKFSSIGIGYNYFLSVHFL